MLDGSFGLVQGTSNLLTSKGFGAHSLLLTIFRRYQPRSPSLARTEEFFWLSTISTTTLRS